LQDLIHGKRKALQFDHNAHLPNIHLVKNVIGIYLAGNQNAFVNVVAYGGGRYIKFA
jgi:hypothetical protein